MQRFSHFSAHELHRAVCKLDCFSLRSNESMKTGFNRVAISDPELFPKHYSGCSLFGFFHSEFAGPIPEHFRPFTHQFWNHSDSQIFLRMQREVRAIHKCALFSGMPVHIDKASNRFHFIVISPLCLRLIRHPVIELFLLVFNQLFDCNHSRMESGVGVLVLTIEIVAAEA